MSVYKIPLCQPDAKTLKTTHPFLHWPRIDWAKVFNRKIAASDIIEFIEKKFLREDQTEVLHRMVYVARAELNKQSDNFRVVEYDVETIKYYANLLHSATNHPCFVPSFIPVNLAVREIQSNNKIHLTVSDCKAILDAMPSLKMLDTKNGPLLRFVNLRERFHEVRGQLCCISRGGSGSTTHRFWEYLYYDWIIDHKVNTALIIEYLETVNFGSLLTKQIGHLAYIANECLRKIDDDQETEDYCKVLLRCAIGHKSFRYMAQGKLTLGDACIQMLGASVLIERDFTELETYLNKIIADDNNKTQE